MAQSSLQKQAIDKIQLAFPGQVLSNEDSTFYFDAVVHDNSNPKSGDFVYYDASESTRFRIKIKKCTGNLANKRVAGVLVKTFPLVSKTTDKSSAYGQDYIARVMYWGRTAIIASSIVKPGNFVLLKDADSTLVFDKDHKKANHIYTGFVVICGNEVANEMCVIQSYPVH